MAVATVALPAGPVAKTVETAGLVAAGAAAALAAMAGAAMAHCHSRRCRSRNHQVTAEAVASFLGIVYGRHIAARGRRRRAARTAG